MKASAVVPVALFRHFLFASIQRKLSGFLRFLMIPGRIFFPSSGIEDSGYQFFNVIKMSIIPLNFFC